MDNQTGENSMNEQLNWELEELAIDGEWEVDLLQWCAGVVNTDRAETVIGTIIMSVEYDDTGEIEMLWRWNVSDTGMNDHLSDSETSFEECKKRAEAAMHSLLAQRVAQYDSDEDTALDDDLAGLEDDPNFQAGYNDAENLDFGTGNYSDNSPNN